MIAIGHSAERRTALVLGGLVGVRKALRIRSDTATPRTVHPAADAARQAGQKVSVAGVSPLSRYPRTGGSAQVE